MKTLSLILFVLSTMFLCSCRSTQLLPSSFDESTTSFSSYSDAMAAYDMIELHTTSKKDLKVLGFDVESGNNVEVLTYLDVSKMFLHNDAIKKSDLPLGVITCLETKEGCRAYQFGVEVINEERYGSFWADVFDFRKKVHHTGWSFEATIIMSDGAVVYKLHKGKRNIDKKIVEKQPLGPLQDKGFHDLIEVL